MRGVAFSPDGTLLATASNDDTARTWDAATGQPAPPSPDTRTGSAPWRSHPTAPSSPPHPTTTARTWDAATGNHRTTLTGHNGHVNAVAFSPDGTLIATASNDHTARIWNVAEVPDARTSRMGRLPWRRTTPSITASITLTGHHGLVNDVAFDPSGQRVLTASGDGTIRIWRLADGTAEHILTGHDGPVTSISLSRRGRILASASTDGTARLWDMATLRPIATLVPLTEGGYATLLPDGSYKLDGDPGDRLWWAMKLCRFAPGELDPYVPEIRRLPADAPILPA